MNQPIAWAYEATEYGDRTYEQGWQRRVSFAKPLDQDSGVRNVTPLYAATPSGHAVDCDWHCDQVPRECTCGLIALVQPPDARLCEITKDARMLATAVIDAKVGCMPPEEMHAIAARIIAANPS